MTAEPKEPMLQTHDLSKKFDDFVAVDKINLHVDQGEIYGLLGPNGAGKSTAIRMLTTLTTPSSGTATIDGYDIIRESEQVREVVGLVSEKMIMYDRLTAYENLRLFAKLYNVPKEEIDNRLSELLKVVNMTKWADEKIEKFSTGMKQRINVIRALVSMPRLVFMDEPTLGLDPQSTADIRDLIRRLRDKDGLTIVLTTHIMNEADLLCDRIGVIDKGRIVAEDSPINLKAKIVEKGNTVVDLDLLNPPVDAGAKLKTIEGVLSASQSENKVKVIIKKEDGFQTVVEGAIKNGFRVRNASVALPSLEDVFLHYTGRSMDATLDEKPSGSHHRRHGPGGGHGGFKPRGRIR
jgi:ABC-2 type transport system ATP-binding protein